MPGTSKRPYLLRALHEWALDAGYTPYLLIDASLPGVDVPDSYVEDARIVLNISPVAVRDLDLGNEWVSFGGRFGGVARQVLVPVSACLAIYARETGEGMMFDADEENAKTDGDPAPEDDPSPPAGPHLKVIK
ncbi:MAG: ClpXP protease specificity-enhancing factor [Pseudomonadales bacterium]|jgi:stringent starvation protein B|nr:ClpXP protease specificity-enhancing factor [Pseudomonadales bacterium]MDP6470868.1 ClpXP protease specificity-enhancing factor [Pseudomonadales bacterium]MDP6825947.1 ClpXP protease specificity-enhancing factor [Pseudomonadales bacterium]MDP6972259.1 ClpXP protease specificity-enhancing factor [Pseudomonadales bacterium]